MLASTLPASKFQMLTVFNFVRDLPVTIVVLMLGAGVAFLFYGRVVFRVAVILNTALVAGALGWHLGQMAGYPKLFAVAFAIAFGLLAWPMLQFGVAILSGLIGAVVAVGVLSRLASNPSYLPIAGGVGFVGFAVLGWCLLMPVVIAVTALQGAAMIVFSALALIDRSNVLITNVPWLVCNRNVWILAAVVALAVLGAIFQIRFVGHDRAKDRGAQQTTTAPK